jgi:hypothetical protein
MIVTRSRERDSTVSPEELAAAMRQGLEARRFFRKPSDEPFPITNFVLPDGSLLPNLLEHGGVVGAPAPAQPGVKGRVVRLLRKVVKKLMNPWLDRQTRFNHTTYDHLQLLQSYLGRLAAQLDAHNEVERRLLAELKASRQATATVTARLNEFFLDVYQLRQAVTAVGGLPTDGSGAPLPAPVDPVHVIEGLFLHTRLSLPPARVLVLDPVGLHALDLASLGYQVTQVGTARAPLVHPDLRIAEAEGRLPFPDGSFDWVAVLATAGPTAGGFETVAGRVDVARLLAPGGRVIGSTPADEAPTPADLAIAVGPLRVTEAVYARRAGHGWALSANESRDAELVLWVASLD